ncbi:hypothetical protein PInf_002479 [Phytophthora infestans]|nr:hypothetical protein PInf_002479 [Phytophthora infestans]
MILGPDLLKGFGLVLNFKEKVVQWDDYAIAVNTGRTSEYAVDQVAEEDVHADESNAVLEGAVQPEVLVRKGLTSEQFIKT